MNCRDSKVAIALHLGHDDADPADWELARRHAATCAACRAHYKRLKKSMALVEQADVEKTYDVRESLWPELESRLAALPTQPRDSINRHWGPIASLTVACLLFVLVLVNPPHEPSPSSNPHQSGRSMSSPFAQVLKQSQRPADREVEKQKRSPETETL